MKMELQRLIIISAILYVAYTDILILSTHGGGIHSYGKQKRCRRVCSGTTGRETTNWIQPMNSLRVTVDISGCQFVTTPVVVMSLEGAGNHLAVAGSSSVYRTNTTHFESYINRAGATINEAKGYGWNVNWIAAGYRC